MNKTTGFKDYYKILKISDTDRRSEEFADILKSKFRDAAKKYHPDVSKLPTEEAEEKFKDANEAYACLGNEELKRKYDSIWIQSRREREKNDRPDFKPSDEVNKKYQGFREDPFFTKVMREWDTEADRMTKEWDTEADRMTKEWDNLSDALGGSESKG